MLSKTVFSILFLLFGFSTFAQNNLIFQGGKNDGHATAVYRQTANNLIFKGGKNDGHSMISFRQPSNNLIFQGGTNDGHSMISFRQPNNNLIFQGGKNDGHSMKSFRLPSNNQIFIGGKNDGHSMAVGSNISYPNAPITVHPVCGSLDLALSVDLNWTSVPEASNYQIMFDDDSNFTTPTFYSTSDTFFNVSNLQYHITYFWRVKAFVGFNESPWSNICNFTTMTDPLPVELLFFDAFLEQDKVICIWETQSEKNTDYFIIERTKDFIQLENIAKIKANDESQNIQKYWSIDPKPHFGKSYYRLKTFDKDGKTTFSLWKPILYNSEKNWSFSILNNPTVYQNIKIKMQDLQEGKIVIQLNNLEGKNIFSQVLQNQNALVIHHTIESQNLASGTYFIRISHQNKTQKQKIILIKN